MVTKALLDKLVEKYEVKSFIDNDPIRFPHRFKNAYDIEIAAFLASIFAYGNRQVFVKRLDVLFEKMQNEPLNYVLNFDEKSRELCDFDYRFSKGCDINEIIFVLKMLYGSDKASLGELLEYGWNIDYSIKNMLIVLTDYFYARVQNDVTKGFYHLIPDARKSSALKRFNMLLRWMVRDGEVDFGLWKFIPKSQLIIPLDTHVARMSQQLGLIEKVGGDFSTAQKITEKLKKFDPKDPVKYDFALFGYGIDNPK